MGFTTGIIRTAGTIYRVPALCLEFHRHDSNNGTRLVITVSISPMRRQRHRVVNLAKVSQLVKKW